MLINKNTFSFYHPCLRFYTEKYKVQGW